MSDYLTKRNGKWHFVRRVPIEFSSFDKRGIVKLSTKVRISADKLGQRASVVADRLNLDLEAFWSKCAAGEADRAAVEHSEAVRRARVLGVDYKAAQLVAREPTLELRERLDLLGQGDRLHDAATRAALLGGVALPRLMLSGLFDEFKSATATERVGYSAGQLTKWEAAKRNALSVFQGLVGDKAFADLDRNDALKLHDHWQGRVLAAKGIAVRTANKNITHVVRMIKVVSRRHHLEVDRAFTGLRLEGAGDGQRKPFEAAFIKGTILRPGALDALNAPARAAVHVMVNTGLRPSEIVNLRPSCICLDAEIPHVLIMPEGRVLKSESSVRAMPLVGIALEAMRAFPSGFDRYVDKENSFSAAVNKYFRDHGMKPSPRHSVYSLRHSFKDRLREAECPDELRDELMGHANGKPKYGDGHGLRLKLRYLQEIALDAATSVQAVSAVA